MWGPREALNKLKWDEHALDDALVWYRHRGAPNDVMCAKGADITRIGASFFHVRNERGWEPTMIPYHRVLRIERGGALVWERRAQQH